MGSVGKTVVITGRNRRGEWVTEKIDPVFIDLMGKDKVVDGKLKVSYGRRLSTLEDYERALEEVRAKRDAIENNKTVIERNVSYSRSGYSELVRLYQNKIAELNSKINFLRRNRRK